MYKPKDLELAARWMVEHYGTATIKSVFRTRVQHFFSVSSKNSIDNITRKMKKAGLIRIDGNVVEFI